MSMQAREASLFEALLVIGFLIFGIGGSVYLFGDNASSGPIQIVLFLIAFIVSGIGLKNGHKWKDIENGIVHSISVATNAILILFMIGALVGAWIMSGTVPSLIYYGLKIISPEIFYPAACLICVFISLSIGSSWSTVATVGVALMGISQVLELSTAVTAGAIVSGAYFGDKMSPLSDTTNLASAVAGSELFAHIRHMMWVSIPSLILALILYAIIGFTDDVVANEITTLDALLNTLDTEFTINVFMFIPLIVLLVLAVKKVPTLITIFAGMLVGVVFALCFQTDVILKFYSDPQAGTGMNITAGIIKVLYGGYVSKTGNAAIDDLLSNGGMGSMANVVWLVLSAMMMAGTLTITGVLSRIVRSLLMATRGVGSLISTTIMTTISANILAADQYMSIIVSGQMWRDEYKKRGLKAINLSRVLEDSGTVTSPLVPWNTCGAYVYGVLGLASFAYIPFCFFNITNPILSAIYGYFGFTITKINEKEK